LKRLFLLGAALLALAACDGGPRVVQTASGKLVYDCATGPETSTPETSTVARTTITPRGRPGPCYDGTDRTDRRNYDTIRNITPIRYDDTRNITPIRYDDTRDRTVYCMDVGAVITAPSFIVFFDWDKSDLTDKALDTIGRAAQAYRSKGGARVTATGHTDTSGPAGYNMALSLRRANAVKDQLVHDGVRAEDISVIGLGETSPMVPTGDGVREAQNRRVEIVLK
jgi:outer membrane protein OmpA-like peptidoglycan-associated protein